MAKVVYQVIPLRRVPAAYAVLDYELSPKECPVEIGEIVSIPFGKSIVQGVIWEKGATPGVRNFIKKQFIKLPTPLYLTSVQCKLMQWLANETLTPLPAIALRMKPAKTYAKVSNRTIQAPKAILASHAEERDRIIQTFAQQVRQQGTTVVFVPALAYAETWEHAFQDQCVVLHSRLSDLQIQKLLAQKPRVIITTHIGVFIPYTNIRHIVVDQADDDGYFAFDQAPRIDMRRCIREITLSYGASLTLIARWQSPTLQGIFPNALWRGKQKLSWTMIDRSGEAGSHRQASVATALVDRVEQGRTLWLVNRKHEAGLLRCADCGKTMQCTQCQRTMRVVREGTVNHLYCVFDNIRQVIPEICPYCKSAQLTTQGKGVRVVAREIQKITHQHVGVVEAGKAPDNLKAQHVVCTTAIANFLTQKFDRAILVRTEGFLSPGNYRSTEELYNVLALVKQHLLPHGEIFCQTFQPENSELQASNLVIAKDIETRKRLHYPPFGLLVVLQPRARLPKYAAHPLPQELLEQFQAVSMEKHRWIIRTSIEKRANTLLILKAKIDDTWEAIVDPPRLPQD